MAAADGLGLPAAVAGLVVMAKFVFQPLSSAPRLTLDLMADTTISVNGGPHHGRWLKRGSEILELTFNYLGQNDRAKTTQMIRIDGTDTWLAKGDWGAVLAPLAGSSNNLARFASSSESPSGQQAAEIQIEQAAAAIQIGQQAAEAIQIGQENGGGIGQSYMSQSLYGEEAAVYTGSSIAPSSSSGVTITESELARCPWLEEASELRG